VSRENEWAPSAAVGPMAARLPKTVVVVDVTSTSTTGEVSQATPSALAVSIRLFLTGTLAASQPQAELESRMDRNSAMHPEPSGPRAAGVIAPALSGAAQRSQTTQNHQAPWRNRQTQRI
jgi:hypothetical protein